MRKTDAAGGVYSLTARSIVATPSAPFSRDLLDSEVVTRTK
jgi:hypothetical protein